MKIQLKPDAKPYALHTPRSVPLPLRDKVRKELERMESLGVISKVDEPTEWCAGMVDVTADASSYGLGAVLLQKHDNNWEPVSCPLGS